MSILCHILSGTFQGSSLWNIQVVIRAQVFNQVILTREAIATFTGAVFDGAIAENRVVNTGLMALQIGKSSKCLAAGITSKWFSRPKME